MGQVRGLAARERGGPARQEIKEQAEADWAWQQEQADQVIQEKDAERERGRRRVRYLPPHVMFGTAEEVAAYERQSSRRRGQFTTPVTIW